MREIVDHSDAAGPARGTLSPTSLAAIRCWLQAQRNEYAAHRVVHKEDIRRALRLVCGDVRARGMRVEELIILLKEQWEHLGDERALSTRSRDILDEIIRTCIDEYYGSASTLAHPPSRGGEGDLRA